MVRICLVCMAHDLGRWLESGRCLMGVDKS